MRGQELRAQAERARVRKRPAEHARVRELEREQPVARATQSDQVVATVAIGTEREVGALERRERLAAIEGAVSDLSAGSILRWRATSRSRARRASSSGSKRST